MEIEAKKIIIAIDGYSSTGKSTLGKMLAKALNYLYIDSGAMYRVVTLYALQKSYIGIDKLNEKKLIENLKNIDISFVYNDDLGFSQVFLNGINVEKEIRSIDVSTHVSKVATIVQVRKYLVEQQREIGKNKGVVMDGRDIGSVVFPNAELKIFINASLEKRASRRYKELLDRGEDISYQEVLRNVEHRDNLDSTRKESPLLRLKDAVFFDNSDMGLHEQFERLLSIAKRRIQIFNSS